MKPGSPRPALSRRRLVGLAAAGLALRAVPAFAAGRSLHGQVSYRERIALPPEALLEVRLVDTSLADSPARSLAVTRVKTRHRTPIPFRLYYDEAKIRRGHVYAIEARITVNGKPWFLTTSRHPVLTGAADDTTIMVELVKSASSIVAALSGRWLAESIRNHGVLGDLKAMIEIAADGKITGSAGCNRISGKATITGAYISFGPMISTKMACAPDVMDRETNFLAALGDARLWRIDEQRDKLILIDDKGFTILKFVRL
jgi:putative lipoprotein